jgi:hypothetical protein
MEILCANPSRALTHTLAVGFMHNHRAAGALISGIELAFSYAEIQVMYPIRNMNLTLIMLDESIANLVAQA